MAELGSLQSGFRPVAYEEHSAPLQPLNIDPTQLVDTGPVSKAKANSVLYGTISKTLEDLPQTIIGSYLKGKQVGTQIAANNILQKAAQGETPNVPLGTNVTPDGMTYSQPNPYAAATAKADLESKAASTAHLKAETRALNGPMDSLDDFWSNGGDAAVPDANGFTTTNGSVFGLVPSGKMDANGKPIFKQDPNDKTDAGTPGFDPTKGAWGDNIKDPSLNGVALTPQAMQRAGIDPNSKQSPAQQGYVAQIRMPNGDGYVMPIVDKKGKEGVDFTYGAYSRIGGNMSEPNGGNIPGVSYKIVKVNSAPATPPAAPSSAPATAGMPAPTPGVRRSRPSDMRFSDDVDTGDDGALSGDDDETQGDDAVSTAERGISGILSGNTPDQSAMQPGSQQQARSTVMPFAPSQGALSDDGGDTTPSQPGAQQGQPRQSQAQITQRPSTGPTADRRVMADGSILEHPDANTYIRHLPTGESLMYQRGQARPTILHDKNTSIGYDNAADAVADFTQNKGLYPTEFTTGEDGKVHVAKAVASQKYSDKAMATIAKAGYTPTPGEPESSAVMNAMKLQAENNELNPYQQQQFDSLAKDMKGNKRLQTIAKAQAAIEDLHAVLHSDHPNPFDVKAALDAFSPIANQGQPLGPRMAQMLKSGSPTFQKLQGFIGDMENLITAGKGGQQQTMLPDAQIKQMRETADTIYGQQKQDADYILNAYRKDTRNKHLVDGSNADSIFAQMGLANNADAQPAQQKPSAAKNSGTRQDPFPAPSSQDEYNAMPEGAFYRWKDGSLKQKTTPARVAGAIPG